MHSIGIAETHLSEMQLQQAAATIRTLGCRISASPAEPSLDSPSGNHGGMLVATPSHIPGTSLSCDFARLLHGFRQKWKHKTIMEILRFGLHTQVCISDESTMTKLQRFLRHGVGCAMDYTCSKGGERQQHNWVHLVLDVYDAVEVL